MLQRLGITSSFRFPATIVFTLAFGALFLRSGSASADPKDSKVDASKSEPKADVMVIHATKCDKKTIDPKIGDTPPSLGYDCMKLVEKKSMPLPLNQPSTTPLPNGRTFQLLHTGMADNRYKLTASISQADGSPGYVKLADITAEPHKSFNVGGFAYQGGVLVLTVRIIP